MIHGGPVITDAGFARCIADIPVHIPLHPDPLVQRLILEISIITDTLMPRMYMPQDKPVH